MPVYCVKKSIIMMAICLSCRRMIQYFDVRLFLSRRLTALKRVNDWVFVILNPTVAERRQGLLRAGEDRDRS